MEPSTVLGKEENQQSKWYHLQWHCSARRFWGQERKSTCFPNRSAVGFSDVFSISEPCFLRYHQKSTFPLTSMVKFWNFYLICPKGYISLKFLIIFKKRWHKPFSRNSLLVLEATVSQETGQSEYKKHHLCLLVKRALAFPQAWYGRSARRSGKKVHANTWCISGTCWTLACCLSSWHHSPPGSWLFSKQLKHNST